MAAEPGQALLQKQSMKRRAATSSDLAIRDVQPTGVGATLDEAGYQQVFATCCHSEMYAFAKRLVSTMKLELCDEGGLAGVVVWYTCEEKRGTHSLDSLKKDIGSGQPPARCAFVAPAGTCPPMDPSCQLAPGEFDANFFKDCNSSTRSGVSSTITPSTTAPTAATASAASAALSASTTATTTSPATTTTTTIACFSEDFLKVANDTCLAAGLGDKYWFSQCRKKVCEECTTGDPTCATEIAVKFDVTGSPSDECWPEMASHAKSACYQELLSNCKVSSAWLKMCVEDVCAALASGAPDPLDTAKSYCENQEMFEESDFLDNADASSVSPSVSEEEACSYQAHDNYCVGANDENLAKTRGSFDNDLSKCKEECSSIDSCSAVEWYPTGNARGFKCFHILDPVPAARGLISSVQRGRSIQCLVKNCDGMLSCLKNPAAEATDARSKCVIPASKTQCDKFATSQSVSVISGSYGDRFPKYCSHHTESGQIKVFWNIDLGDGDSVSTSTIRLCCGEQFLPTTTTTTRAPRPSKAPMDHNEPPLRPYPVPPVAATIQRPINPVIGECFAFADPHVRPFDFAKGAGEKDIYDSYESGNYWLVKSTAVWIQGHQAGRSLIFDSTLDDGFRNHASLLKVAVGGPFLQGNTLMIEGAKDGAQVWWNDKIMLSGAEPVNGQTHLQEMRGSVKIVRRNTKPRIRATETALPFKIEVELPEQVSLKISVHPRDEQTEASNLDCVIRTQQITAMDGMCGNFNGILSDDTPSSPGGVQDRFGGLSNRVSDDQLLIPY